MSASPLHTPESGYTDAEAAAAADYAGRFEQPTLGTGDIADTKWGWWFRTTDSTLWKVRNRSNVLYYVEATPGAP